MIIRLRTPGAHDQARFAAYVAPPVKRSRGVCEGAGGTNRASARSRQSFRLIRQHGEAQKERNARNHIHLKYRIFHNKETLMGSGYWSADVYETAQRLRNGKSAFAYSDSGARTVHPDLDPFDVGIGDATCDRAPLQIGLDTAAGSEARLKVCAAYDIDGRRQARIKPGPPRDLAYQEELTRALTRAVPVYRAAPRTGADWRDEIADLLRAPVAVTSSGPAVADKTCHHPLRALSR
jgi:hypothetical protein